MSSCIDWRQAFTVLALLLATCQCVAADEANSFPSRSINIKVPFAAGGAGDILARAAAQFTSTETGWQFYVENNSGAAGLAGAQAAARAAADGYTLLICNISCVTNQFVFPEAKWDAKSALDPVIALGYLPNVLVVGPSVRATTLKEFIDSARAHPESLSVATSGTGTSSSLTAQLLGVKTGVQFREIPYRGSAAAIPDLIAGRVDAMLMGVPESLSLVHDGKVKALGVTSKSRAPSLPDVPTIDEAGVPGYRFEVWSSFFVPKGTPVEIIGKLNAGFNKALASPALKTRYSELSFQVLGGGPELAGTLLSDDIEIWGPILRTQKPPAN